MGPEATIETKPHTNETNLIKIKSIFSAEKETVTMKTSEDKSSSNTNKALLIDQVRTELESYFAPQNIQNDFNLRQKMTSDGYIDIDWLLELKLISDLASNRDILISAIS